MKLAATAFATAAAIAALAVPASAFATSRVAAAIPTASTAQASSPGDGDTTSSTTTSLTPGLATPLNLASGRVALTAYAAYLQSLLKASSSATQSDQTYVTDISYGCKSALAALKAPGVQITTAEQTMLTTIGQEMGDDLTLGYDASYLVPLNKLSLTLTKLKWTRGSRNARIVQRYLTGQTDTITLPQSELCQDALLARATPTIVPTATKSFLKQYTKRSATASATLNDFLALLRAYETPAEQKTVTRIATLATEVNRTSRASLQVSGDELAGVLEAN